MKQQPDNLRYREYKKIDFPEFEKEILNLWKEKDIFKKSVETRNGKKPFIFYEGPPSANGMPGIHHVMSRTIKDIFCRYKTLKGFQVKRKGGWDTHGLPIELQVEKRLGITKEDIGKKISIAEYNKACREDVLKFKNVWDNLTERIGYWVDLDNPYITYDNRYIESLWHLLKKLYDKGYLYKGFTIQPFSPAAGTGLSSHELNQPGTYKMVKDTTVVAQFKMIENEIPFSKKLKELSDQDVYFLAWTTTPWTLPSNTALAIGEKIKYNLVKTFNPYTFQPVSLILASDLLSKYFSKESAELNFKDYKPGDKKIPFENIAEFTGKDLLGIRYEQLLPYAQPEEGDAFRVVAGDFVTTEDGTGIVHIAPSFGSDDFKVAKQNGIGSLTLVDRQGKFLDSVTDYAGMYVKNYDNRDETAPDFKTVDVLIAIKLKEENKAFKVEKYEHSYPHCWRTDKPILYYPLESWFIKTTAVKERMVELNKTINWKPESTGTGRFGNWLENLVDWNLSRSRYWGTPLPIWVSEDKQEFKCIGSLDELKSEIKKSVDKGFMNSGFLQKMETELNSNSFDLHRPNVDEIILCSDSGQKMLREADLIDVWFDSGAMPYAQWHYPFENEEEFKNAFPADYIAEGVDQTRGWFFTLHAISVLLFDSVSYKNVIANGLVLDKEGNKMSKRTGNVVDPFSTIDKYGSDATRWYLISNAQPWENLKFDMEGLVEVQRKLFATLYNIYSFYALYANIDKFNYSEPELDHNSRPEIDRWILSLLNSLVLFVDEKMNEYEPTQAARAIQDFVGEHLSNWYVRLCRRRFWKGEYSQDKISAYQTLYTCLETIAKLMSPVAPFYSEKLFSDLNSVTGRSNLESVHLTDFPLADKNLIDKELETRMQIAQDISSLALSLRKKVNIRVRQPLQKILIPVFDVKNKERIEMVKDLILSEINVKEISFITDTTGVLTKRIKPNFKVLGPVFGAKMKAVALFISGFNQDQINVLDRTGEIELEFEAEQIKILKSQVEISSEDIPGWQVANDGNLTVALDVTVTDELRNEGVARELVNRIQNLRKESDFQVTDRIIVKIQDNNLIKGAIQNYKTYICSETLAEELLVSSKIENPQIIEIDDVQTEINISKLN